VNSEHLRETLRQDLAFARMQTDALFQMLAPAALHERPIPERHRIIFYLGHLEAFDWNMIGSTSFGMRSSNSQFDRLFEFGIDPVDGKLPQDKPSDWPGLEEILSYRDRIRSAVDDLLDRAKFANASQPFVDNGQIFRVAIEHRLMHAETLAYLFHWLPYEMKRGISGRRDNSIQNSSSVLKLQVDIPAGRAILGQQAEGPGSFGWDNEFQTHSVFAPEFCIDAFNVTNDQFLEFIQAGGYSQRSLWREEAWQWIQREGVAHPKFWIRRGEHWLYRTMFEEVPLPPAWPVYVSHAEAAAYTCWKEMALPTEAQYHRAAFGSPDGSERKFVPAGNFNFRSWTPEPVGSSMDSVSAFGVCDLVGNGWEWTSTPFAPFDGFRPFPFYPGYSADFFDGKHFVLKGASPRTSALLVRQSFRNWFQPHYPNIYATFRCVRN
jgi:gamma-glutamyl hercynylcysteine S-oxide synthase